MSKDKSAISWNFPANSFLFRNGFPAKYLKLGFLLTFPQAIPKRKLSLPFFSLFLGNKESLLQNLLIKCICYTNSLLNVFKLICKFHLYLVLLLLCPFIQDLFHITNKINFQQ